MSLIRPAGGGIKPRPQPADPPLLSPRLMCSPGFLSADAALSINGLRGTRLDHRAEENRGVERKCARSFVAASTLLSSLSTIRGKSCCSAAALWLPLPATAEPRLLIQTSALYPRLRPRSEAGCFSAPLLAPVGRPPSEGPAFLFCLSTGDVVGVELQRPWRQNRFSSSVIIFYNLQYMNNLYFSFFLKKPLVLSAFPTYRHRCPI